ncbi:ribosomal protein S18-domain-containing protein [Mortierella sp. GBAus27b]|nr:hypothetical protein BGX31_001202 [Mortierella sp. GBA43]KAI8357406.1 ribosomal protein S18-domain-containing protein [Mortierella sp. GBAus27b]
MLASVHRAAQSARSIAPRLCSASSVPAHNLVARRFKSGDADDRDPRHYADSLMNIISGSIQSQTTGLSANEQTRVSRGNFYKGDIYKPSDLNDSRTTSYPATPKPVDELKILKLNPLVEYKNPSLLSHYITPLGRLMSREQTGLSAKNQRRLSRAVRRARALCIISPTAKLH